MKYESQYPLPFSSTLIHGLVYISSKTMMKAVVPNTYSSSSMKCLENWVDGCLDCWEGDG